MVMVELSIIIPVYNSGRFLRYALESVFKQTYKNYEVIVVYRDSQDDSGEIIDSYRDRINLVVQEGRGLASARNMGINVSKGEYIAFLDADDMWTPDKLDLQVKLLKEDYEIGLVFSDANIVNLLKKTCLKGSCLFNMYRGYVFEKLFLLNFIPCCSVIVRKKCFNKVGFFDDELILGEDWDMWLRIAKHYKVDYVDECLAIYRIHSKNISRDSENMLKSKIKVWQKNIKIINSTKISPKTIRDTSYRAYYSLANMQLWKGNVRQATILYLKCLKYDNLNPILYVKLMYTILDPFRVARASEKTLIEPLIRRTLKLIYTREHAMLDL